MKERKQSLFTRLRLRLTADEMFHETEVQANRLGFVILLCNGIVLMLVVALTAVGIFPLSWESVFPPTIQAIVEVLILLFICKLVKNDAWWLKYLLIIGLVVVYARLDSMLTHKASLLMILPVVFSSRYFSKRLTVFTSLFSTVVFFFSALWGATHGFINLNIVTMPAGTEITATGGFLGEAVKNAGASDRMLIINTLLYDYLPKWFMFSITSVISCNIARRGRNMVLTQHEKDVKTARIESELNLATRIQADMLPNTFPAFPGRVEFDIYASMDPAKEVGGDFYDFFLIDDDHLYMAVADVSGKGVPAALFMMASKIILANNAIAGKSPAQILTDTNAAICSNNREEMFVTVWIGILELSTGKLTAANAGHEYPVIKNPDGVFKLLKDKHGFVIGGMSGIKYKEYELTLSPGSKIFLYTDGVPEATDAENRLFGADRMIQALNQKPEASPEEILKNIRKSVDDFAGGAEQFDDLTMLCVEYTGNDNNDDHKLTGRNCSDNAAQTEKGVLKQLPEEKGSPNELDIEAVVDNLQEVIEFVNARLAEAKCSAKMQMQMDVAVEEIFVNISNYAYSPDVGNATVRVEFSKEPVTVTITFVDSGIPYDPLKKEDPDISLSAEEREIGGLGIFMTKRMMDDVYYEYKDGKNILKIRKNID
ncbi:MAG: SpoIIE family protein phosphatase [Clostridia bacterium]|nr:SpoIIE family protein phosphatase [Clostridia bacterium]